MFGIDTSRAEIELLDELDTCADHILQRTLRDKYPIGSVVSGSFVPHWTWLVFPEKNNESDQPNFLSFSAIFNLEFYVASKLKDSDSKRDEKSGRSLLSYALGMIVDPLYGLSPGVIKMLFQHGADPYHPHDGRTPWEELLMRDCGGNGLRKRTNSWRAAVEIFFQHLQFPRQISTIASMVESYRGDLIKEDYHFLQSHLQELVSRMKDT